MRFIVETFLLLRVCWKSANKRKNLMDAFPHVYGPDCKKAPIDIYKKDRTT